MNRIYMLRKARNLSQLELAKELNVHQTAISQWETERTNPDMSTIEMLADYFNVTTDYLLGRTEDLAPKTTKEKTFIKDEDLKFALWGRTDVDDKALEDVKRFARFMELEDKEAK